MRKLYETLNAENWIKAAYTNRERHCLVGHMKLRGIYGGIEGYSRVLDAIMLLFPERVLYKRTMLTGEIFNDHPDTTLADVLRVCKLADV